MPFSLDYLSLDRLQPIRLLSKGLFHVNLPEMGTLRPQVSQCIILYLDSEFLCCAPHIPSAMVMETVVQHPNEFINPSDDFNLIVPQNMASNSKNVKSHFSLV